MVDPDERAAAHAAYKPFADVLREAARRYSDRPAVVFEDQTLTYAELFSRACRLGNALVELGVRPGDRVATLQYNRLESIEEVCAIALAGGVRVPLYSHNALRVHQHMLAGTAARVLIVDDTHAEMVRGRLLGCPDLERVIVHGTAEPGELTYADVLASGDDSEPGVNRGPDDVSVIRFSSGTTGLPKGIFHSERRYFELGEAMARALPTVDAGSVQLVSGPLSHIAGILIWPVIARGACQVLMPRFETERFLALVERHGVTFSFLVPATIASVVSHPDAMRRDLSTLQWIMYGGAPVDEDTIRAARELWGPILVQSYGQSECCPIAVLPRQSHIPDSDDVRRGRLRSAGRPVEGIELRILDDDRREVAAGETGEVAVRAAWTMDGIWGDADATAARFTADGFLLTRDMGRIEDGWLFLSDRKDDMIISGGFNIWPTEIEQALLEHPAVGEVAVVGVPHDRWGETPLAVVVASGEGDLPGEDELIAWCRDRVGGVKKPTQVLVQVEPLPRSVTGKVLRRQIRASVDRGPDGRDRSK